MLTIITLTTAGLFAYSIANRSLWVTITLGAFLAVEHVATITAVREREDG